VRAAVLIAVAVSLLVAAAGPRLGRRLPPATAARLLAVASVLVAGCTVFVAGVLAFTWVGQLAPVAALGEWSATELRAADPIPTTVAAACTILLLPAATWWLTVVARRCRELIAVHRTCRHLPAAGTLIVVADERPDAFTTPQPAGRIVVTTGLLHALTGDERRVVLAHETSHLRHRHAWWLLAADLAAAANPLLRPTAAAVARAIERWADEDAATSVGDRRVAARALARTALLTRNPGLAARLTLAATGGDVPARVRALLAPPPPRRPASVAALTALLAVLAAATVMVQHRGEQLFEHASRHPAAAAPPAANCVAMPPAATHHRQAASARCTPTP
jgi:Zn-dependent protease with chaperone function